MRKSFLIIGALIALSLGFGSCDKKGSTGENSLEENSSSTMEESHEGMDMGEKVTYTCTMHPEVISDTPGKCPKCGMELVKKEEEHENLDSTIH